MTMKHKISSDDSGSTGSDGSAKSEEWISSVSDNIPAYSQGTAGYGAGVEPVDEGHIFFEIQETTKTLDKKVHLAMVQRINDLLWKCPTFLKPKMVSILFTRLVATDFIYKFLNSSWKNFTLTSIGQSVQAEQRKLRCMLLVNTSK
jgi:hypothetical protein